MKIILPDGSVEEAKDELRAIRVHLAILCLHPKTG